MGYAGEAYGEADLKSNINVAVGISLAETMLRLFYVILILNILNKYAVALG
jgi:hypothetical protein